MNDSVELKQAVPRPYNEVHSYRTDAVAHGMTRIPTSIGYTCDQGPIPITADSFIASQLLGDGTLVVRRNNPRLDGTLPVEVSWSHSAKVKDYTYLKWHIAKALELKPWKVIVDNSTSRYSKLPLVKSGMSIRD